MTAQLSVLLTTEDTYPYQEGGVSMWCEALIRNMPDASFVIAGISARPARPLISKLPPNVSRVIPVPLWGTMGVSEIRSDLDWRGVRQLRAGARQPATITRFADLFKILVADLIDEHANVKRLTLTLRDLARIFVTSDYDILMHHPITWRAMKAVIEEWAKGWAEPAQGSPVRPSLYDVTEALHVLTRWLAPIGVPMPRSQIVHATTAGLSSLPAIVSRAEYGTPFLLTEHEIYLRERLIAWTASDASPFMKWFAVRVTRRIVELSLAMADVIVPVSGWGGRWQQQLGAAPSHIEPIRTGVDPLRCAPQAMPAWAQPTMIWLGRINPLKDVITLIEAMDLVRREMPAARTLLFSKASVGDAAYEAQCRSRIADLGLEQSILFKDFAPSLNEVFAQGHLSVISSISEALPFPAIEAMFCGRPVVGTAVGGVPEVLVEGGMLVQPRNPADLARACLTLLRDPPQCEALGSRARIHAEANFSLGRAIHAYANLYRRMQGLLVCSKRVVPAWARHGAEVFVDGFAD